MLCQFNLIGTLLVNGGPVHQIITPPPNWPAQQRFGSVHESAFIIFFLLLFEQHRDVSFPPAAGLAGCRVRRSPHKQEAKGWMRLNELSQSAARNPPGLHTLARSLAFFFLWPSTVSRPGLRINSSYTGRDWRNGTRRNGGWITVKLRSEMSLQHPAYSRVSRAGIYWNFFSDAEFSDIFRMRIGEVLEMMCCREINRSFRCDLCHSIGVNRVQVNMFASNKAEWPRLNHATCVPDV